jgi:hypothetical protein
MPETVGSFEFFQLPCYSTESSRTKKYAEFVNPLGPDGYVTKVQYGADTGLQEFWVKYDPLPGFTTGNTIIFAGVTMTKAAYIRDFFDRHTISGIPFVIQCIENSQFYLVRFNDSQQTLTRKFAASYATDVNFIQERRYGVTVFDPSVLSGIWGWYDGASFRFISGQVFDKSGSGHDLEILSDVSSGTYNDLSIAIFNDDDPTLPDDGPGINPAHTPDDPDVPSGGYIRSDLSPLIKEALFVMKMDQPSFSNYAGILTADTGTAAIVGGSGTTKFYNLAFSHYEYRKNGVEYIATNQLAPMDTWGLVHARWQDGIGLTHLQIGRDRDFGGRYAKMEIGEIFLFTTLQPLSTSRELAEHLQTKWAV